MTKPSFHEQHWIQLTEIWTYRVITVIRVCTFFLVINFSRHTLKEAINPGANWSPSTISLEWQVQSHIAVTVTTGG